MSRAIKEGDTVNISFGTGYIIWCAEVLHRPTDTGDLWYIRETDGDIVGINPMSSNFDWICKPKSLQEE